MAEKLVSLHIRNKKGKTRAIGSSVVGPHGEGLVHLNSIGHVQYAMRLEEEGEIEILNDIPNFIREQVEAKNANESQFNLNPIDEVREKYDGFNTHQKNQAGWNSPHMAYRGADLADRDRGFASTSSNATKEDSDSKKIGPDGEEVETTPIDSQSASSAWNSPDDAYAGEDLKDREYDEESVKELMENKNQEASKFEQRKKVGPQDQVGDNTQAKDAPTVKEDNDANAKEVKGDAADNKKEEEDEESKALTEKANQENQDIAADKGKTFNPEGSNDGNDEKPSWYLTYKEVEKKSKNELIDWAEKDVPEEEGLKISKSRNAGEVKEDVHAFLSERFEDHEE